MELSILASTASASASTPASTSLPAPPDTFPGPYLSSRLAFGTPPSIGPPQQHYPSPPKDSAARRVADTTHHIMAATSHANGGPAAPQAFSGSRSVSPRASAAIPKSVAFELLFPDSPQYRARLPLRVSIFPHDTTDSIVTTVKNFYGLYSGPTVSKGVSFEDERGHTLIARYENFRDNMTVYVRVIEEPAPAPGTFPPHPYQSAPVSTQAYYAADGYPLQPPPQHAQTASRPASRTSRRRSPSPTGRGRRSASASTNPGGRSKKGRSRSSRVQANYDAHSDVNGYSSGDGAPGSVSGKAKEQIGNTDISVENIVEGGRRKRAKFESSELPLFAPPQMPAATSNPSVSPARRTEHRNSLPFVQPGQHPFIHPQPLQSPQSCGHGARHQPPIYATPGSDGRRTRDSIGYVGAPPTAGMNILPTPDPTVGSCMSEEDKDVAIQLMRLGEMSNMSHGRTSASTLDDTFSGRADAASSAGATSDSDSDSEDEMSAARRQKLDVSGRHKKVFMSPSGHFHPAATAAPHESVEVSGDDADYEDGPEEGLMAAPKLKNPKPPKASGDNAYGGATTTKAKSQLPTSKAKPPPKAGNKSRPKKASVSGPMSPTSLPASRKPSIASNAAGLPLAPGEEEQPDLSTKPRCQRCRKSKKGCDRQRPCGRCRDAGIPAELCISEDEGNGRKGRYGRHMGVPIKKEEASAAAAAHSLLPAAPIAAAVATTSATSAAAITTTAATTASFISGSDKNKKRKR